MFRIATKDIAAGCVSNLYQVHRLRRAILKDQLGWDATVSGELDDDEYNGLGPTDLLSIDRYGTVNGCLRLPATGPDMLRDIFPSVVTKAAVPRGERVRKASRIAVSATSSGLQQANHKRSTAC